MFGVMLHLSLCLLNKCHPIESGCIHAHIWPLICSLFDIFKWWTLRAAWPKQTLVLSRPLCDVVISFRIRVFLAIFQGLYLPFDKLYEDGN